jgi:hypothetical protein
MTGEPAPRVYLHCGPPKTATTALQFALQCGDYSFFYGGSIQPRSANQDTYAGVLLAAVSAENSGSAGLNKALIDIRQKLDAGTDVVISEEMFLVDGIVSHQEKIGRLSIIFRDFPVTPVICLRDPVDGLPSLYQEVYGELPLSQKLSFQKFLAGNQAKVFDYRHVSDLLKSEFGEVNMIWFTDLVANQLMLSDFIGGQYADDKKILLDKENASVISAKGRKLGPIRLSDIFPIQANLGHLLPSGIKEKLKQFGFLQSGRRILASTPVTPRRNRELSVPKELAEELRDKLVALKEPER